MKKVIQFRDKNTYHRNYTKIQLIGMKTKITWDEKTFTGLIINETKNTIQIKTDLGVKVIPKAHAKFTINHNNQTIQLDGNQLKGRHEDRIKHRMKRKW
jgi:RNase P/RNase MRP subunit p29